MLRLMFGMLFESEVVRLADAGLVFMLFVLLFNAVNTLVAV